MKTTSDRGAGGWAALQARRIRWILRDLLLLVRGLAPVLVRSPAAEPDVVIALLEGHAWALEGKPNAYRVRLVNDRPEPLSVVLRLRGERQGRSSLATDVEYALPARSAEELYLVTDWVDRFAVTRTPPASDGLEFLATAEPAGKCRLTALLEANGRELDRLAVAHPVLAT